MKKLPDPATASEKVMKKRVAEIVQLFEDDQGALKWHHEGDPLEGLVQTLLSHNTNDNNRDKAYGNLLHHYPTWAEVHHADYEELVEVVRVAGLNRQKAKRIQDLLDFLYNTYGDYTADFLREMDYDTAFETLGHLNGVSYKTLAVVMCFDLGVDVFAVDTHVHRICKRIGLVPEKFDPVKTFKAMRPLVPAGKSYQFHLQMINHGRQVCDARKPKCEKCILNRRCKYYLENS